jgi:hypothetical protein
MSEAKRGFAAMLDGETAGKIVFTLDPASSMRRS